MIPYCPLPSCKKNLIFDGLSQAKMAKKPFLTLKAKGDYGVKKTSLCHIKVQSVMELQNLCFWWKYGASNIWDIAQSYTKYRGESDQNDNLLSIFPEVFVS